MREMTEGENTQGGGRGSTRICSVLFVDIVGYSKKTNAEQIVLKRQFVESWTAATKDIPAGDIMVVDAGDGAALTSLVEPEDTLRVALRLHELLSGESAKLELPMQLRMGVNFGPVQLSQDVHGKACIVGDAINMAQRIMSFAEGGQITISRSYYDAIVPLSHKYGEMFRYLGRRSDKHGRQHEIYVFGAPSQAPAKDSAPVDNFVRHGEEVAAARRGVAEGERPGPVGLLVNGVKFVIAWLFGTIQGFFRKIITVTVVLLFLYELLVLIPLSGYPGAVKAELWQQLEVVKLLAVGEWQAAKAVAARPTKLEEEAAAAGLRKDRTSRTTN